MEHQDRKDRAVSPADGHARDVRGGRAHLDGDGARGASWPGGTLTELLPAPSRAFAASAAPPGPAGGPHPTGAPGDWAVEIWRPGIAGDEAVEADALKDVLVVCHYAVHRDP